MKPTSQISCVDHTKIHCLGQRTFSMYHGPLLCCLSHWHKVWPGASHWPLGEYFLISWNRWTEWLPGFLPDFKCHNIIYQISILCMGMSLTNEHSQGKAPATWCTLHFQSVSFLWTCQLLPLIFSIQGPLMTTKRNAQCSCGPTWAFPAGKLKPVVGSVFPEPVVGVVSGILNTCRPASWAFPLSPSPSSIRIWNAAALAPEKGEPKGQDISLFGLLGWAQPSQKLHCAEAFVVLPLCLNELRVQENFLFNEIEWNNHKRPQQKTSGL